MNDTIRKLWVQKCTTVLSDKLFVPTHLHNFKNTGHTVTFLVHVHIKQLFYYQRQPLCSLELHEIPDWRATAPVTQCGLSLIQIVSVYCQSIRRLPFGAQLHDRKTHIASNW